MLGFCFSSSPGVTTSKLLTSVLDVPTLPVLDDGADVSENYTSKDDEWNRITHWTLHEFEPYKSYSYHYHNIKHPKKRF